MAKTTGSANMPPPMPSLADLKFALSTHDGGRVPLEKPMKKAAVAAIFRERPVAKTLDLLLIRRAEHPEDPWSGHMAFPGGRVDATDKSPLAAALRETREEIDLDLNAHGTRIGELSHVLAKSHGRPLPLIIVPHVFAIEGDPALTPEPLEVAEALFIPFDYFLDPNNRTTMQRRYAGIPMTFECVRYEDRVIWGLTLKMIGELVALF